MQSRLHEAGPRAEYEKFLRGVHRKLGQVKTTTTVNWSVNNHNLRTTVVLVQNTQYDEGQATETFTYAVDGVP